MRQDRIAIALLVALIIVAFSNVIFAGKSLVTSENANPLDYRVLAQNHGPDFVPLEAWSKRNLVPHPNFRDPAAATLQMDPAAEFLRRSLARGEFPFWDPYVGGGMPSFATLIPAYLFPPSLLVALLGNGSALKNAYILLLIAASGILTYKLLRQRGLSWQSALAGGIAFSFSGAMLQTISAGLGQPVAFFSLALLVSARLVDRPSARRAAELAAAFAFIALATFPPILMQVFGTCVVYVIVAVAQRAVQGRARVSGWFAAGALTGAAITAIAYIPAFAVMSAAPHIAKFYSTAGLDALTPDQHLGQLLSPTIMGGVPVYANPVFPETGGNLYYTGVVAILCAGIGVFARTAAAARTLKITAIVVGALSLAKLFAVPPIQWIAYVPLLRSIHYGTYFGIVVAYTIAILAALGIDAIVGGRARWWHVAANAALLAGALGVVRHLASSRFQVEFHPEGWRWIADFRLLVLFSAIATLCAFVAMRRSRAAVAALLIVGVLAVEALTNSMYPRQRRWNLWRHPPRYVEVLAELGTGGRVIPMPMYPANTQSVFRQPTLDSITLFTSPRMYELYRHYFQPGIKHFLIQTQRIPPERVLDAANIEYLAIIFADTKSLAEAEIRGYPTIYKDDLLQLVRRPTAPRYRFTSDYRVVTPEAALEQLASLPPATVLLEQTPSFAPVAAPDAPLPRVVRFELNEIEIAVDAPRAGILYCSESVMNGWTAFVDGRATPILHANYAFRAVEVPPGRHVVRLRYRPPGFVAGVLVSFAGIIACGWGLRRRPAAQHESAS